MPRRTVTDSSKTQSNRRSNLVGALSSSGTSAVVEHVAFQRGLKEDGRERISRSEKRNQKKAEKQLRKERLAANRRSATTSRQRRKILIQELQDSLASLVKENAEFHHENEGLKEQVEKLEEENRRLTASPNIEMQNNGSTVSAFVYIPRDLSSRLDMKDTHLSPFTTGATAMAGLDIGLGRADGVLHHQAQNRSSIAVANSNAQETPLVRSTPAIDNSTVSLSPDSTQLLLQQQEAAPSGRFDSAQ